MASPAASSPGLLTTAQLKNLDMHKYSCAGRSLAEWPLQMFWNWLVKFVPLWVAPNTLTIIGLFLNSLSTVVLFIYSPHASEEVRSLHQSKVPVTWFLYWNSCLSIWTVYYVLCYGCLIGHLMQGVAYQELISSLLS